MYLIEDYGSIKHMSLPEKSIVQADVNTQLVDNFIVHHTTDPKDSAHYLIEMTQFLSKRYLKSTINVCSKASLDDYYQNMKASSMRTNLMTLSEFNQFSNKNKPMTIKEMFARCLMKIHGMSQDKCLAILNFYSTPNK